MDTAIVLTNQQQVVREQEQPSKKPLEVEMFEEVRELYMATMETNPDFRGELDTYWFRHHFATVAHKQGMIHHKGVLYPSDAQKEDHDRYNLYFRLVRDRLSPWLKQHAAAKREARQNPNTVYPSYHKLAVQPSLFPEFRGRDHNKSILKKGAHLPHEEPERHEPPLFDEINPRQLRLFGNVPGHVYETLAKLRQRAEASKKRESKVKVKY